jgi:ATP-binding cassette subfamily B multidrug efflux pump
MMMQQRPGQPGRGGPMMGRGMMGGMMGGPAVKARDFRGTMRKLVAYLSQYKLAIVLVFVVAIASTAANIAGPKILGNATTKLFEGIVAQIQGTGSIDFDYIGYIMVELAIMYLIA